MMKIHHVESLELPALEPYRTLRRPLEHIRDGIFVAEGGNVVRRLLDSHLQPVSILLTPEWLEELSKKHSLEGIDLYIADKKVAEAIVGYSLHQGVMAVALVPSEPTFDGLLASLPHPFLLVAMDGIVNAENAGVIVRNCGAFGADAILVDHSSASPYLRRAVRNSMGAVFHLPVLHLNLAEMLPKLNCRVIATTPAGESSLHDADLSGDLCVVFGNEGRGVSQAVLEKSDLRVAIPMRNEIDSLNVGSSSAIFLYEVSKQR
jgi:tRNA G18 (ribose-2'-O)-methylase SpoU